MIWTTHPSRLTRPDGWGPTMSHLFREEIHQHPKESLSRWIETAWFTGVRYYLSPETAAEMKRLPAE